MWLPVPVTHTDRHSLTQFVNVQRAQTSAGWSAKSSHKGVQPFIKYPVLEDSVHNVGCQCFLFHGAFLVTLVSPAHDQSVGTAQAELNPLGALKAPSWQWCHCFWGPRVVAEDIHDDGSCMHVVPLKSRHARVPSLQTPELEADVLASCPWSLHPSVQPQRVWSECLSPAWGCLFLFTKTSVNS